MRRMTTFIMLLCLSVIGQHAFAQTSGTVTYVYTDPQGTPLAEADASGNITATFDYTPYGTTALGNAPNGPGYTGHVNDPETNLVYMQARYYDPVTGHFLSVDPIIPLGGDVFNFNRYSYADNSPVINIDPTGLCTDSQQDGQTQCAPQNDQQQGQQQQGQQQSPISPKTDPVVRVTANVPKIDSQSFEGIPPPIFRLPPGRALFRIPWYKPVAEKIDDFMSKQLVKKLSFRTLTIGKTGYAEATPWTFGIWAALHADPLGGCDSNGHCADETRPGSNLSGVMPSQAATTVPSQAANTNGQ